MNLAELKRQSVPLHAEVASLLRNQIYSGTLPAGAQLPPLSELTESLGVARMTIRQAMDALEEEGLIERHSGRGTFVKPVKMKERHSFKLHAPMSQLSEMVEQLEVSVTVNESTVEDKEIDGVPFRRMTRIHSLDGKPFCHVDLQLVSSIYDQAPQRFSSEIVVSVLNDIGIEIDAAHQRVTISYADVEIAQVLGIKLNSPVFRVFREFFDKDGKLVYSALLIYPGDVLEFNVEFSV
ncbi:MAG: GntR family transcriptional regulator [Pseudomonadota bacterium]